MPWSGPRSRTGALRVRRTWHQPALTRNHPLADTFQTEKYLGPHNLTENYWKYQRAGLEDQTRYIREGLEMLLVHGMEDRITHIQHTMTLARVSILCQAYLNDSCFYFSGSHGQQHYFPATGKKQLVKLLLPSCTAFKYRTAFPFNVYNDNCQPCSAKHQINF